MIKKDLLNTIKEKYLIITKSNFFSESINTYYSYISNTFKIRQNKTYVVLIDKTMVIKSLSLLLKICFRICQNYLNFGFRAPNKVAQKLYLKTYNFSK